MKAHTKDERFMICLYETALSKEDPYTVLNRYEVGQQVGLTERAVNAIVKLLSQANFVKRIGDEGICLTKHGESLAVRLRGE